MDSIWVDFQNIENLLPRISQNQDPAAGAGQGGRVRLVGLQLVGIFEGVADHAGCLVDGRLQSPGWFEGRHQRSFPNQGGPVCGVARVGARGTGLGRLSISSLGDKKGDAKTIVFCDTRGPGVVGC
jgi:hypothetical protein